MLVAKLLRAKILLIYFVYPFVFVCASYEKDCNPKNFRFDLVLMNSEEAPDNRTMGSSHL